MGALTRSNQIGADLTQGNILKKLLLFAVPIVLTNLIQQVYSMVDLAIIGQFMGSAGTVGVGTGGEIADLGTTIAVAFAAAGQIYIAQLAGAKDDKRIKEAIGTLITLMVLLSAVTLACVLVFCRPLLSALNCPQEGYAQAENYMLITAFGMPFIFGYNAICAICRGLGESKRPLYFISVAAVLNIILDILFVAVFHLEAAGTALATVLAQVGSFLAAFYFLYSSRERFDFELKLSYFKIKWRPLKVILTLGLPHLAQSGLVHFSLLWVNSNINAFGLVTSATNSIGNKVQKMITIFTTSFATGAGAMIAQNLGAKKYDRVKKVVWITLGCTLTVATIGSILAIVAPKALFGLFTADQAVLDFCVVYMKIMILTYYSSAFMTAFQSVVTGAGFATFSMLLGLLDGVVCRIGFSLLFLYVFDFGNLSFFFGNGMARTLPALIAFLYFISGKWKTRKLLGEK